MTKLSDGQGNAAEIERRRREAANRALAEAAERRSSQDLNAKAPPLETGGRDGLDPTRYGDWEKGGIVSDF